MTPTFLLGIDQGTSGSKALILDGDGRVCGYAHRPLARLYPQPGWVEQDPHAVAQGVAEAVSEALAQAGLHPRQLAACGLTCQRNTAFAWDSHTGRPLGPAITWQDLRTLPLLEAFHRWPLAAEARYRLGYAPGPYMAALHLAWRMQHEPALAEAARAGRLRLGLSAAWLLTALGEPAGHLMDASLVQAMGLYDFRAQAYWEAWLTWLGAPRDALPEVAPTLYPFGHLRVTAPNGTTAAVPVLAMLGDQQAALFGHGRRQPGDAECTHGTASYVKVFLGEHAPVQEKINVYYAWQLDGRQTYCLEAPTSVTGAAIRWLCENGRMFDSYQELDELAGTTLDSGGLTLVPAFTGLETPYNDPATRAAFFGLTLGHHRGHIARAMLEAIGYQMRAIVETIAQEAGVKVQELLVGGGVSASDLACQVQADLTGLPVKRPSFTETTAWAAGLLAGLGAGFWPQPDALPPAPGGASYFEPTWSAARRQAGYERWQTAVHLAQAWGR